MRLFQFRRMLTLLCGLTGLLFTSLLFAKPVNLYEQPKVDSKVVGTINSATSMVPIITSKEGDWMKIGDPQNGNVGWIKVNDVATNTNNGLTTTGFSMTEKTINTANGPKTSRVLQFGNTPPLTPEQSQAVTTEILKRQAAIQKNAMQMLQNVFDSTNAMYKANPDLYNNFYFSMVPMVAVPVAKQPAITSPTQAVPTQKP
jgi:hypothetical protein